MAKTLSPVCKLCRREGEKLFLKGERCYTPKCAIEKRNFAPGQHGRTASRGGGRGMGTGRASDFARQLRAPYARSDTSLRARRDYLRGAHARCGAGRAVPYARAVTGCTRNCAADGTGVGLISILA